MIKIVESIPGVKGDIDAFMKNSHWFNLSKRCFTSINWKSNEDVHRARDQKNKAKIKETQHQRTLHTQEIKERLQKSDADKVQKLQS